MPQFPLHYILTDRSNLYKEWLHSVGVAYSYSLEKDTITQPKPVVVVSTTATTRSPHLRDPLYPHSTFQVHSIDEAISDPLRGLGSYRCPHTEPFTGLPWESSAGQCHFYTSPATKKINRGSGNPPLLTMQGSCGPCSAPIISGRLPQCLCIREACSRSGLWQTPE